MAITTIVIGTANNTEASTHSLFTAFGHVNSNFTDLDTTKLNLDGTQTMTGLLTLSGAPTADLHASTKKYVDDQITSASGDYLPLAGGTMTGNIVVKSTGATYPEIFFGYDSGGVTNYGSILYNSSGDFGIGSLNGADLVLAANNLVRATFDGTTGVCTFDYAVKFADGTGSSTFTGNSIEVNVDGTGDRNAFIDFHGDDTNTDFGLRIIRTDGGVNGSSRIVHAGTGGLQLETLATTGSIQFMKNNGVIAQFDSDSNFNGATLKNYGEAESTGSVSGNFNIDIANGNVFTHTITGATTYTFDHNNHACTSFVLVIVNGGSNVTWPTGILWEGKSKPTLLTASGKDIFTFIRADSLWYGSYSLDVGTDD